MVDSVGNVSVTPQSAALAAQASEDLKQQEKIEREDAAGSKNLSVHDIPIEAGAQVPVDEVLDTDDAAGAEGVEETSEAAESILSEIDYQLSNVQKGLKEFVGKKIKLAAKNPARGKELLQSAYRDTKKAYDKIKKVRDQLS